MYMKETAQYLGVGEICDKATETGQEISFLIETGLEGINN